MKHQMSFRTYENLSFIFLGLSTGYVGKLMNIHFLQWGSKAVEAGLTAGVCGAMGLIGKKVAEWGYSCIKEYIINKRAKKQLKPKNKE